MGAFDQSKCDLPTIEPISALPAIEDCAVPEFPFDGFLLECADIEIALPGADGGDGAPGLPGAAGPPGVQGPPGTSGGCPCGNTIYVWTGFGWNQVSSACPSHAAAPSTPGSVVGQTAQSCCPPRFESSASGLCVGSLGATGVEVDVEPLDGCRFNIDWDFTLYCPGGGFSVEPVTGACGSGVSGVSSLQFVDIEPGCCDFRVAGSTVRLGTVRHRMGTVASTISLGSLPHATVVDNETGQSFIVDFPRAGWTDPNVRGGDQVAFGVRSDGCRGVAIGDYSDDKVGTAKWLSWSLAELSAKSAFMTSRGWEVWMAMAGKFPVGQSTGGQDFDGAGGDLLAGSTGGRKDHGGPEDNDHKPHIFIHNHRVEMTETCLRITTPENTFIYTEPAEANADFTDPITGTTRHYEHRHTVYPGPVQFHSGDIKFWHHPADPIQTAGLCSDNPHLTSFPLSLDCGPHPGFDHEIQDPKHAHRFDLSTLTAGLTIIPMCHTHPPFDTPGNEEPHLLMHTPANHIPPYRVTVYVRRIN